MICPKCGDKKSDNSIFCNKCGEKLNNETQSEKLIKSKIKIVKDKIKLTKKTGILYSIVLLIVVCLLISIYYYLNNPVLKFKNSINNNKYIEAMMIYNDKIKGNTNNETIIASFLIDKIMKIEASFINDDIDYDKAMNSLETIIHTRLLSNDIHNNAFNRLRNHNNSKKAFKNAEENLKNNDFCNAIKEYKEVLPDDRNYEKAKERIANNISNYKEQVLRITENSLNTKEYNQIISLLKEANLLIPNDSDLINQLSICEAKVKADQLVIVESAKILVRSADYKAIWPDAINVITRNVSEKTVKDMTIGCLGYDNNGYPIKIKGELDFYGGEFEVVINASNANIVAGSKFGENRGWELDTLHGISTVLACVKNATFYDGTIWENPYYEYWIEQYKEKPLNI